MNKLPAPEKIQNLIGELRGISYLAVRNKICLRFRYYRGDFRFDKTVTTSHDSRKPKDYEKVYELLLKHIEATEWEPNSFTKMKSLAISVYKTCRYGQHSDCPWLEKAKMVQEQRDIEEEQLNRHIGDHARQDGETKTYKYQEEIYTELKLIRNYLERLTLTQNL